MAGCQRGVELPHSIPLLGNDLGVDSAVGPAHQAGKGAVVPVRVDAVDALVLNPPDARAEAPSEDIGTLAPI